MKGFMVTPLVFIALIIIVIGLGVHVFQTDMNIMQSISAEGAAKKLSADLREDFERFSVVAFETMMMSNTINDKDVMEQKINSFIPATVTILNGSHKSTLVSIVMKEQLKKSISGNTILNTSGASYIANISYPFYDYYIFHTTGYSSAIAALCAAGNGGIVAGNYIISNFTFSVYQVTALPPVPPETKTTYQFKVNIYDDNNALTRFYQFQLQNAQHSSTLQVTC